jgi:hypothetical protein
MTGSPERMEVVSNPHAAAVRRRRLESYMNADVLADGHFVCRHQGRCKESALRQPGVAYHEGQLSYVGPHYDLRSSGRELRVLIVPMETGGPPGHVSIDERSRQVRGRIRDAFGSRNPHMRGVTLAIQLAFGLPLGTSDGEWLSSNIGPIHILDGYAMANLLLCSAVHAGTKTSKATSTMRANCIEHLVKTIEILEPTLIISQGKTVEPTLRAAFEADEQIDERVWKARCAASEFVWVPLHHPTRNWESPGRPYFREVVAPAITQARTAVLGIGRDGGWAPDAPERPRATLRPRERSSEASTRAQATSRMDMRHHPELSVPERSRFGKSAETCVEALRRYRDGASHSDIARWLRLSPTQVRYLLMQQRVEDGEVARVDPTRGAIRAALDRGGEFGTIAWVACRAGVVENYVQRVRRSGSTTTTH